MEDFNDIKNDCACNGHDNSCDDPFVAHCHKCGSSNTYFDVKKGCYVCEDCGHKFVTERFIID